MNRTGFLMAQGLKHTYRDKKQEGNLGQRRIQREVAFSLTGRDKGQDQRLSRTKIFGTQKDLK